MKATDANSGDRVSWGQFAAILMAAIALGLIYNSLSPLRVHAVVENDPGVSTTISAINNSPFARKGVHNETLSLTLETSTASAHSSSVANTSPNPQPNIPPAVGLHIPALKWPEVKALLGAGSIVLLDARLQANYDLGHIPGAILLPATSTPEELRAFAQRYPKDTPLVTYCGSDTCDMSHVLAEQLIKVCGFTNVRNMPGGFAEYAIAEAASK